MYFIMRNKFNSLWRIWGHNAVEQKYLNPTIYTAFEYFNKFRDCTDVIGFLYYGLVTLYGVTE